MLTRLGLVAGIALMFALVVWRGIEPVAQALVALGWGLLLLPPAYLPSLGLAAASWRPLFRPRREPSLAAALRATWIGNSVSLLLPVTGLGGEVVRARLVALDGIRARDAAASVIAGQAVQALSLAVWALLGAGLLAARTGESALAVAVTIAAGLVMAGTLGFVAVQHAGVAGRVAGALARLVRGGDGMTAKSGGLRLDAALRRIYARPRRLALALALHLAARVALALEVWLAAYLIGMSLTFTDALMVKSLTGAARGLLFMVPGGIGIQEAGYVALAAVVDASPAALLAVSLATRGRELVIGAPGLLAWHRAEARALRGRA